jgi:methionyl-tRNA formyltransferase
MSSPRIVFFGTPIFAAEVLQHMLDKGMSIVGVVSKPDKAQGRSKALVPTPVKQIAMQHGLPLIQPERVSAAEHIPQLQAWQADLFVVVAYGEIIKEHLLQMPPLGCINLHASLLPLYRGAAPIQRCLMDGVDVTGVTVMHMVKQMDAGDIIATAEVVIDDAMDAGMLATQLCEKGKVLLCQVVDALADGTAPRQVQDSAAVTYAPKIELEECQIDWNLPAHRLHNLVRGANPEPGAWCYVQVRDQRKRLRIMGTRVHPEIQENPGAIVSYGSRLIIATGEGGLEIVTLQLEGKRQMPAMELMRGMSQAVFQLVI